MKKKLNDILVIGFALFAMFFGAGNLIFPPSIGKAVGDQYMLAAFGFIITGVGIPFMGILASTKYHGNFEQMLERVDGRFAVICATMLFLALGPMLAIPRTAATTYELMVSPLIPGISPLISAIIYFAINLCFILKPSSIIDNIGKYLTPALIVILMTLIIKGIMSPIGPIVNTNATNVLSSSLLEGYQTMDALGALVFASLIVNSVKSKGYKTEEIIPMTVKSGVVALTGLIVVYAGLMFLGSQTSVIIPGTVSKTQLLLEISKRNLGGMGSLLIGLAIALACLTTSIGLISASATFFEKLSRGRLTYKFNAIAVSVASIIIGSMGVDKIVAYAVPILSILYPVAITLIVITLMGGLVKDDKVVRNSVYTALFVSVICILPTLGVNADFINKIVSILPLSSLGFGWLLPTVTVFMLSKIHGILTFEKQN